MTSDLERRMLSHQTCDEMCAKHTKFRQPAELVFFVSDIANGILARKVEKYIKVLTREHKEELIKGNEKRLKLLYKNLMRIVDNYSEYLFFHHVDFYRFEMTGVNIFI